MAYKPLPPAPERVPEKGWEWDEPFEFEEGAPQQDRLKAAKAGLDWGQRQHSGLRDVTPGPEGPPAGVEISDVTPGSGPLEVWIHKDTSHGDTPPAQEHKLEGQDWALPEIRQREGSGLTYYQALQRVVSHSGQGFEKLPPREGQWWTELEDAAQKLLAARDAGTAQLDPKLEYDLETLMKFVAAREQPA